MANAQPAWWRVPPRTGLGEGVPRVVSGSRGKLCLPFMGEGFLCLRTAEHASDTHLVTVMNARWVSLTGHLGEKAGRCMVRAQFPPWVFLSVSKGPYSIFGRLVVWMLSIGRARHPEPARSKGVPDRLTVELVHVGGWLTHGDLTTNSCARFLAFVEHRLIPARVRSVGHQLHQADFHSFWALACQDHISGGHAGVGVVRSSRLKNLL